MGQFEKKFSSDEIKTPNYKVSFTRWRKGSPEEFSENEPDQSTEPPLGKLREVIPGIVIFLD